MPYEVPISSLSVLWSWPYSLHSCPKWLNYGDWQAIVQNKESKARAATPIGILPSLYEGEGQRLMFCTVMEAKNGLLYIWCQQRCSWASYCQQKLLAWRICFVPTPGFVLFMMWRKSPMARRDMAELCVMERSQMPWPGSWISTS